MTPANTPAADTTPAQGGTARPRLLTVAVAAVVCALVWLVATAALDVDVTATTGSSETTVGLLSVLIATAVSGLLGWGLLALLERKTSSPRKVFVVIAVLVLVLSMFAGPLGGVTTGATVTLVVLHVAAAAVLIPGLARTVQQR